MMIATRHHCPWPKHISIKVFQGCCPRMSHDEDMHICKMLRKLYEPLPCDLKIQLSIESVVQRFVHPEGLSQLYTILELYKATWRNVSRIPLSVMAMVNFIESIGHQTPRKTTSDHEEKRLRSLFGYLDPVFRTIGMDEIDESITNGEINSIIDRLEILYVQQQYLHDTKTLVLFQYFKSLLYSIQHRMAQSCLSHNDTISWC